MVTHGCACCAEHRPEHRRTTVKQPSVRPIPASTHNGTPPHTPGTGRPPPPPPRARETRGTFGGHRRRPHHATPPGTRNPPQARRTTVGNRAGDAPHARHRRRTGRQRKRALGDIPTSRFSFNGKTGIRALFRLRSRRDALRAKSPPSAEPTGCTPPRPADHARPAPRRAARPASRPGAPSASSALWRS